MKYPLTTYQHLLRQIKCSIVGHDWKSSWRKRPDFEWAMEHYDELPYARKRCDGNPYWEYSKRWHFKCKRCRKTTKEFCPMFIRQQLFRGIRSAYITYFKYWPENKSDLTPSELPHYQKLRFFHAVNDFVIYQDWVWPSLQNMYFQFEDWVMKDIYGKSNEQHSSESS